MARLLYTIRPLEHGLSHEIPSLYLEGGYASGASNVRINQRSVQKRWGYAQDRNLGTAVNVYDIAIYQLISGTRHTVYLTGTDLCKKETATGKTFSYQTERYITGTVSNITNAVVTGDSTAWNTSGVAAGDKFILDTDLTADEEPDTNWATVLTVDGATQITLSANYTGTTGAFAPTKAYRIRRVYSVPTRERWAYAIVDNKFCFTNGAVNVQYWDGTNAATNLDSTNAVQARYCIEYANRLFLGDTYVSGVRAPLTIQWSKENDPTNWVDSTAGSNDFLETEDYITGLGRMGNDLVVYKREAIIIGNRTGNSTDPVEFPRFRPGIGCIAPYSIVEFGATNAFLGRNDFYYIYGDYPVPISEKTESRVKYRFFDIVGETEREHTWGFHNHLTSEICWVANTTEGVKGFVWNYKTNEWYEYVWAHSILGAGRGAL